MMAGIFSIFYGETTCPILFLRDISIGSKERLFTSGFKIFFGTSIKITEHSKVNAYSIEMPDQSDIIHIEL